MTDQEQLQTEEQKSPRVQTGIAGLDQILDGGFLYHNSVLLMGEPGSGKTTLGIQAIRNGALLYDEPGIIVLFEQFPQQLYRDLATYGWNIEELIEQKKLAVIFAQPDQIGTHQHIADSPLMSQIHDVKLELGAKRILIDGMAQFASLVQTDVNWRELFLKSINIFKSIGLTPFITAGGEAGEQNLGFEEYLSDCVLALSNEGSKDKTFPMRLLQVKKSRGQEHIRGKHPYRIGAQGIEVFPHLPPRPYAAELSVDSDIERAPSGISGLNDMLGGGYGQGTATIVAGLPGTFKTTLGVQFLLDGAEQDERGLLISFNESPQFLARAMKSKGLDLAQQVKEERLALWHFFPKTFYMDELFGLLEQELREHQTKRLVIDGLNELERGIEDPDAYKDFIAAFQSLLNQHQVTSLFLQKFEEFTGNSPLNNVRYASMFDGIVYLGTVELESAVHKVISVLKMRGGDFASDVREISCGASGLFVLDKFVGVSGILAGNPQGHYKKTIEEIFQPLYFVRDFLPMLDAAETGEEQRSQMVANLSSEVAKLLEKLEEFYDLKKE